MNTTDNIPDEDIRIIAPARVLVPRVRVAAAKLSAIASVNRAVHHDIYNAAIAAAAQRVNA